MKLKDITGLPKHPEVKLLNQYDRVTFADGVETKDVIVRSGNTIIGRRQIVQRKVK